ncbi:MAG: SpoIIE family protein phosphatase [Actinobacteria bacterium]|nr:SpoIIE family protein phosphatase [Actinomycetota bacterium]
MAEDFREMLAQALRESHLLHPGAVADLAQQAGQAIGARDYVVHLVDFDQNVLVPLLGDHSEAYDVDTSAAGQAFTSGEVIDVPHEQGRQLWVPLIDGAERLGVIGLVVEEINDDLPAQVMTLASLMAEFIVTKGQYTDAYAVAARRQDMTLAAEMQWRLLPPLTCTTRRVAIAAIVEPAYDLGGDVFDYAVNDDIAHLVIADAIGHGLTAVWPATLALGSIRHSRRRNLDLPGMYNAASEVLSEHFAEPTFVTAHLVELNIANGRLCWLNAGHPSPLLVRSGTVVGELQCRPSPPLGIGSEVTEVAEVTLEPWDRVLFFTDGVVEGHRRGGQTFGDERLVQAVNDASLDGHGPAETVRRLAKAVLAHHAHGLTDDFTLVMVEYRAGEASPVPDAVRIVEQRTL